VTARGAVQADLLQDQVQVLEAFRRELRCTWVAATEAEALLADVTDRLRDRQRRTALLEGEALSERIGAAHAARDWAALNDLLSRYEALRASGFLQATERMTTVVQQAQQDWQSQRRRDQDDADFAELLGQVRRELFEKLEPGPDLTACTDELRKRFRDRPLPEEIERRLPLALALLADRAVRDRRLRAFRAWGLGAAGVLAAAAGAALFAWHSTQSRWAREIGHAIELRDVEGAQRLVGSLSTEHPLLWRSARLRALEAPLESLRLEVAANRRQGDLLIAQATAFREGGWTASQQEIDAVFAGLARLDGAQGCDLTADQRDRLATLRSEREADRARRQGEVDAAFAARLEEVRVSLDTIAVEALAPEPLRGHVDKAEELLRRCGALRREPGVSPELQEAGLARLEGPLKRLRDIGAQRLEALADLRRAGTLDAFLEALSALVTLYGNDPRLARTAAILENRADYALFAAYVGADLSDPLRQGLAGELLRCSERVGPANRYWTEPLLRYGAHLRGLSSVPDVRAAVQRLARNELLGRLWNATFFTAEGRSLSGVLRWPDDTDLFGQFDSRQTKLRVNNRPVTGVRVTNGAYYIAAQGDTLPEFVEVDAENWIVVTAVTPRGHCLFLRRVAEELPADNAQLPGYLLLRLIELHQDMSICPYLKVQLLSEFITLYGDLVGQPLLPAALLRLQQGSNEIGREVNWLCTESDEHVRVREKAVFLLGQTPLDAKSIQAELQLAVAVAEATLWNGVLWAGSAAADGDGPLMLSGPRPEGLWVLRPGSAPKTLQPVEVPVVPDGDSLRPAVAGCLAPYEPVFRPRIARGREDLVQTVSSRRGANPEALRRQLEACPSWPRPAVGEPR
jgi:hypothetical protein